MTETYVYLVTQYQVTIEDDIFKFIWLKLTPSKVDIFGWRLVHNMLQIKDNLFKRNIIPQGETLIVYCVI